MRVKLFGGPRHLDEDLFRDCRRIEVPVCTSPERVLRAALWNTTEAQMELMMERTFEVTTYYLREYHLQGLTEAGCRVRKNVWVGLWEDQPLLNREEHALLDYMETFPWRWDRKPSILKEFDWWFEYTYCEVTNKRPKVRY